MRLVPAAAAAVIGLLAGLITASPAGATEPTTLAVEGTVRVIVVDHGAAGHDELTWVVTDGGAAIPVELAQDAPANGRFTGELVVSGGVADALDDRDLLPRAGTTLAEQGRAGRAAIAAAARSRTPLQVASSAVAPAESEPVEPGDHHAFIAVMRGVGSVEESDDEITDVVEDAASYWRAESDGAITSFDIEELAEFTTATDASTDDSCGMFDPWDVWWEAGLLFSDEPEVMFGVASRNHLVVVMADECGIGPRGGVAQLGAGLSSGGPLSIALGDAAVQAATHELGHTFGLRHANLDQCDQPTVCGTGEYFDFYSPMGGGSWPEDGDAPFSPPALDSAYRWLLGLASDDEVPVVESRGEAVSRYVDLKPRSAFSGVRGVRVVDPVSGDTYFVDYRAGTHRDANTFYARYYGWQWQVDGSPYTTYYRPGVTISLLSPDGEITLLSRRSAEAVEGSLGADEVFTTPSGAVTIATGVLATGWGADVTITVTPPPAAPSAPPAAPEPAPATLVAGKPTITGTARVGRTLRVATGSWSPRPSLSYQWYANGRKITRKGTGKTFTLTSRQKGKRITVRVTGRKAGYVTASATSRATAKVGRAARKK